MSKEWLIPDSRGDPMVGVILAGGKGKRLGAKETKPLVKLLDKPLIVHVAEKVKQAKIVDELIIVANPKNKDEISRLIPQALIVIQKEQLGTAHALSLALEEVSEDENVLVLYADTPLIRPGTIRGIVETHVLEDADITFLTGLTGEEYPYAVVFRSKTGKIVDLVEHGKPSGPPPWEYSIGTYVFKASVFKNNYELVTPRPDTGEKYIPDVIRIAIKRGFKVTTHVCLDDREYLGINTPDDLRKAEEIVLEREVEDSELFEERYIKFGTGGWRAVIGRGFTSSNIKRVAHAISRYLVEKGLKERGVVVGYDNRFLSEESAKVAAEVFAGNNIKVSLTRSAIPTPLVTFTVLRKKAGGGVIITASHNPPEYNGIKFETSDGLPAPVEVTNEIEKIANEVDPFTVPWFPFEVAIKKGYISIEDFRGEYLDYLEKKIDIEEIKKAHLRVCFDTMYGSGTSTIQMALVMARCDLTILHGRRDPLFGGKSPAPSEESLTYLMDVMRSGEYDVGIAVDGDADRIALVDETGRFLHPNDVLPLLYYYLHRVKNQKGPAVRNVATSHNLDRLAKKLRERVIETPVGFKHIAKAMIENDALIGGESSGGITFRNHIMEKDGVFTAMLVVEMLAKMKKKLSEILREMIEFSETWYSFYQENLRLTPTLRVKAEKFLKRDFDKIAEFPVIDVIRIDGTKYILEDGSWVLLRLSGTEPLLRIIAESENKEKARELVEWMKREIG